MTTERYELEDSSGTLLLENGTDNYRLDFPILVDNSTVGVTESKNFVKTLIRNIADTVGITEVAQKVTGFVKVATSFIVGVETVNNDKLRTNAYLQENGVDAFLLEDGTGIYIIDYPLKVANETVGTVESAQNIQGLLEIISDTIGLTYVNNTVKGFVKVATQFIVSVEDAINKLLTDVNVYQLEDGLGNYLLESGAGFYELDQLLVVKNATPSTVGVTETPQKVPGILKNIASQLNIVEAVNRARTMVRTVALETAGLVESINLGIRKTATTATVGLTESTNKAFNLVRTLTSTAGLVEASQYVRGLTKNVTVDTIGLTEATNFIEGIVKYIAETIGLSDLINRIKAVFISNNLGDFIGTDSKDTGIFLAIDSLDVETMTVIDSYNLGDFIIIDDN